MERAFDKLILTATCLVCFFALNLAEGQGGAHIAPPTAADVALVLLAIAATATTEALPARWRALAPAAYSILAPLTVAGACMLPLALYDAVREKHRPLPARAAFVFPLVAFAIAVALQQPPFAETLGIASVMALAALLSVRTNRLLARQAIFNRSRDDLALRTQAARKRTHELEVELTHLRQSANAETSADTIDDAVDENAARPAVFACLTDREYEVARLVADGLDNREIAATAYLGEGTVRNHISTILSKLNLKNRTQIAALYWQSTIKR